MSKLFKWFIIIGCGAMFAWWILTVGQRQVNPGPPVKAKQMRVVA